MRTIINMRYSRNDPLQNPGRYGLTAALRTKTSHVDEQSIVTSQAVATPGCRCFFSHCQITNTRFGVQFFLLRNELLHKIAYMGAKADEEAPWT